MKIVILGAGEIGRHIAEHLANTQHDAVVIERDPLLAAELEKMDGTVVTGDGSMVRVLEEANAGQCDLFMALTSDPATNLAAAAIVKQMNSNEALKTIARTSHHSFNEESARVRLGIDDAELFNVDYVFSSERLAATELVKYIRNPSALRVIEIAGGSIEMQQVTIAGKSKADGHTLKEMELPPGVRVAAVHRENRYFIPTAEDRLEASDEVTMFGNQTALKNTLPLFDRRKRGAHRQVFIFGGGEYGAALAKLLLDWDHHVTILDRDPKACDRLKKEMPGVTVESVDATSLAELKELNVGKADYFVATTQSDEDNVMTCMQAHDLGDVTCLTLIHRADYARVLSGAGTRLGIKAAVSPREATLNDLLRFISEDSSHVMAELDFGELIETTVKPECAADGRTVAAIPWPSNCVVVGLGHKRKVKLPAAGDIVRGGDNLYAVVDPKSRPALLRLLGR